jgi:hypothetical protein
LAVELLPMLEAEAKERQRSHSKTAPGRAKTVVTETSQVKGSLEMFARRARDKSAVVQVAPKYVQGWSCLIN